MYVFSYFPFGFEGRIRDLTVSVDHCSSFNLFSLHSADSHFAQEQFRNCLARQSESVTGNANNIGDECYKSVTQV